MASRTFKPKASSNSEGANVPEKETVTMTSPEEEETLSETTIETSKDESSNTSESTTIMVDSEKEDSPEKSNDTEPNVTFKQDPPKNIAERNVKICLKVNHSCSIGGHAYHFEKGKQYNVPESVKTILLKAELLMPL